MKSGNTNEIGGYLELDSYRMSMLHEKAIALNTGRNCLRYLIISKKIKQIIIPFFNCSAIEEICSEYGISIRKYSVNTSFEPLVEHVSGDEWLYVVNHYGQLSRNYLYGLKERFKNVIFDQAHSYYSEPIPGSDNIYTCRKFFGVPDGAFLYTDSNFGEKIEMDRSGGGMYHILGRFEGTASDFYERFMSHEKELAERPLRRMSKLTYNLLHGIDYEFCRMVRERNYNVLCAELSDINELDTVIPTGPYMYPLLLKNAPQIRKALLERHIYIPLLWPNVLDDCGKDSLDHRLARDILPLPCDQRYSEADMRYVAQKVKEYYEQI